MKDNFNNNNTKGEHTDSALRKPKFLAFSKVFSILFILVSFFTLVYIGILLAPIFDGVNDAKDAVGIFFGVIFLYIALPSGALATLFSALGLRKAKKYFQTNGIADKQKGELTFFKALVTVSVIMFAIGLFFLIT